MDSHKAGNCGICMLGLKTHTQQHVPLTGPRASQEDAASGTKPSAPARMHLHGPGYGSWKAGQSPKTGATSQERYLVEGGRQVGGIQGTAGPKVNQIYPLPKHPPPQT